MVSFRSLPVTIKELIKNGERPALEAELQKARYSSAVRLAARHHFTQTHRQDESGGNKK